MTNLAYTGNWAFSSLQDYAECPHRFRLGKIDKLPKPALPPDNPLERGNRVHDCLEHYVKGDLDTLDGCEAKAIDKFQALLDKARTQYSEGIASVEENWTFDRDWEIVERDDPGLWLWSKLDLNVRDELGLKTVVVDYKTGKSGYKAIQHLKQMQLYAAVTALRQPWADFIHVELWYVDEGHTNSRLFTRDQALAFVGRFEREAKKIYADRFFKPNPTKETCRWCPFGAKNGTGACPVSVR